MLSWGGGFSLQEGGQPWGVRCVGGQLRWESVWEGPLDGRYGALGLHADKAYLFNEPVKDAVGEAVLFLVRDDGQVHAGLLTLSLRRQPVQSVPDQLVAVAPVFIAAGAVACDGKLNTMAW